MDAYTVAPRVSIQFVEGVLYSFQVFLELSALIDCTRKSRHLHIHGLSPCEKHVSQTSGGATIWKFIPIAPLYTVAKAHMLRMRKEILRGMTAHVVVPREKGYITL